MRVLFVTTDHYPHSGACTNILKKLFFDGGLLQQADEVHVLTYKYDYAEPDFEELEGVTIHRTFLWSRMSVSQLKKHAKRHPLAISKACVQRLIQKLFPKLFRNEFPKRGTYKQLFRELLRIDAQTFDAIVPIAGDFATVQAVWMLKKKYSHVNMVIYQVDPCATNLTALKETLKKRQTFEDRVYAEAKAVITTDIICKEQATRQPAEIISRFVPMEFPVVFEEQKVNEENYAFGQSVRCLFVGNIYGGIRDPRYTLRLFEKIKNIEAIRFDIVGGVDEADFDGHFPDNVRLCGSCSLEEMGAIMGSASVLINIGNKMKNQVPSKIFDYIATGKPIINICKCRDCPTLKYLQDYPLCLNLFEEDALLDEQAELLKDFILENNAKRVKTESLKELYRECSVDYCAKIMYDALRRKGN